MQQKTFTKNEYIAGIVTAVIIILFYFLFNLNYLSNWIDEKGDA